MFDNQAEAAWRVELFALIQRCARLDWLLLTKRPENIRRCCLRTGVTGIERVARHDRGRSGRYDRRWGHLAKVKAAVKFVSYEPAIRPLRLSPGAQPDWLICGGESGHGARVMNPQWARNVIADCRKFGVKPFHKQWGTYASNPLVFERGMSAGEAELRDDHGKGGGLIDGKIVPISGAAETGSLTLQPPIVTIKTWLRASRALYLRISPSGSEANYFSQDPTTALDREQGEAHRALSSLLCVHNPPWLLH